MILINGTNIVLFSCSQLKQFKATPHA
uniref:Uncharacterized protein n=1 Tax=Rhizophora mucronata TaxID=61149 RepID=A0A2P2P824_RHIMU